MILFRIIGVFWLSICSMFSYGCNESCNYKELDVQETSIKQKGAYTKSNEGHSFYIMTPYEYLPYFEKVQCLNTLLGNVIPNSAANIHGWVYYDDIGNLSRTSTFDLNQDYPNMPLTWGGYSMFIYPSYYSALTDSNFNYINWDYRVKLITITIENSPYPQYTLVNAMNILTITFTTTTNTIYTYKLIQKFDPLVQTPGQDVLYNTNIQEVDDLPYQYWYPYMDTENNGWGVGFYNFSYGGYDVCPFYQTYMYLGDTDLEAYSNGYDAGYEAANDSYYQSGYDAGFVAGQQTRNNTDYTAGYNAGLTDAGGTNPYLNSIANGIFQVGLLPVNVFLSIFNFELFGINISGLVSGLLTMTIVVIIVRFLFGGKNDK